MFRKKKEITKKSFVNEPMSEKTKLAIKLFNSSRKPMCVSHEYIESLNDSALTDEQVKQLKRTAILNVKHI